MTYEASQLAIHHGDNFDLTCTVRGFPANITTIKTRTEVELKNQIRGRLDSFTTRAFVPIMGSEHTEFFCVSESYFLGSLVARLEERISVHFYSEFLCHLCHTFYPSSMSVSFCFLVSLIPFFFSSSSDNLHHWVCRTKPRWLWQTRSSDMHHKGISGHWEHCGLVG